MRRKVERRLGGFAVEFGEIGVLCEDRVPGRSRRLGVVIREGSRRRYPLVAALNSSRVSLPVSCCLPIPRQHDSGFFQHRSDACGNYIWTAVLQSRISCPSPLPLLRVYDLPFHKVTLQ